MFCFPFYFIFLVLFYSAFHRASFYHVYGAERSIIVHNASTYANAYTHRHTVEGDGILMIQLPPIIIVHTAYPRLAHAPLAPNDLITPIMPSRLPLPLLSPVHSVLSLLSPHLPHTRG